FPNPDRPPAWRLVPLFVLDPFEAGRRMLAVSVFAAVAIVLPKRPGSDALATFGPTVVFALFMLNPIYSSRLSLSYMPLHALLAADGIARLAGLVRRPRLALAAQLVVVAALAGRLASWTLGPLSEVRRSDPPPVQAMKWVRRNIPIGSTLFIDGGYGPLAGVYLTSYDA